MTMSTFSDGFLKQSTVKLHHCGSWSIDEPSLLFIAIYVNSLYSQSVFAFAVYITQFVYQTFEPLPIADN